MKIVTRKGKKFMISEIELRTNNLGEVHWMVHFDQGWNSVWAKTEKQALAKAKKEYSRFGEVSVSVMTDEKEMSALSNFW